MIVKIKKMIKYILNLPNYNKLLKDIKTTKNKRVFILGIPEHGNLGDHAIAYAQNKFIKKSIKNSDLIELPYLLCEKQTNKLKQKINEEDILCLMGGGSMGSLWKDVELYYRKIVRTFPNNKIIIFPHTIYYSKDELNNNFFKESIDIYNSHKNLYIIAREKNSYIFLNKYYQNANILLTPDIVLTLEENKSMERNNVLICLRKDKESNIKDFFTKEIINYVETSNNKYSITDTVIGGKVNLFNRERKLKDKWLEFSKSKIVITDRLHGMIFSIITGTPCVAFDNKSKKVSGVLGLIEKHVKNVNLVESLDEFKMSYDELLDVEIEEYTNTLILPMYEELLKVLKG